MIHEWTWLLPRQFSLYNLAFVCTAYYVIATRIRYYWIRMFRNNFAYKWENVCLSKIIELHLIKKKKWKSVANINKREQSIEVKNLKIRRTKCVMYSLFNENHIYIYIYFFLLYNISANIKLNISFFTTVFLINLMKK